MRIKKLLYTLKHRKAFIKLEKELLGKNTLRGYLHDIDKVFLYLILGVKLTHKIHRRFSSHHLPQCLKSKEKIRQAIIDWECARDTKPDKQLPARQFVEVKYMEYYDILNPMLIELGL